MPLTKKDKEFSLALISPLGMNTMDLERGLTNLLILLRFDGVPTVRKSARLLTVHDLTEIACSRDQALALQGFANHVDIVKQWLESDLLNLVKRGDPRKENLASARPLHLNAYRLRNPQHCRDYGASIAIYNLLAWVPGDVLGQLREFFAEGVEPYSDRYDGTTDLDIETTLLLRLTDEAVRDQPDPKRKPIRAQPLCVSQARVFADDLRRILAYRERIPRVVMVDYLKTMMGFHLGLYTMQLVGVLPQLVENERHLDWCELCHADMDETTGCSLCPLRTDIVVDLGDSARSHMADLSRQSLRRLMGRLDHYIKAHMTVKKLHEFAERLVQRGKLKEAPQDVIGILALRQTSDPITFEAFFEERISDLVATDDDQEADMRLLEIRKLGMSPLETYVEMLYLLRQRFHVKYFTELLDSLLQKNQEAGLMRQGRGQINNQRRFAIGSQLLESLAQIAVLKQVGDRFVTEPLLIDEFIDFLRDRYGIHVASLPEGTEPTPADLAALRGNMTEFKRRLREIGFYTDLSDASISQLIQPRYTIEATV